MKFEFENMTVRKLKNNGPIDLKVSPTGYDWSKLYTILISELKI